MIIIDDHGPSEAEMKVIWAGFRQRCEIAKAIGISMRDIIAEQKEPPDGYRLDFATQYWIPKNVEFFR